MYTTFYSDILKEETAVTPRHKEKEGARYKV
jgi:hypothetical protein